MDLLSVMDLMLPTCLPNHKCISDKFVVGGGDCSLCQKKVVPVGEAVAELVLVVVFLALCDKVVRKERWRLSLGSYDSSSHL